METMGLRFEVAEQRLGERALNTVQRSQLLFDFASDGIHVLDLDGNLMESSESFRSMLGYSRGRRRP